jgi:hypothetical protein
MQDHLPGRVDRVFCKELGLWDSFQLLASLVLKKEI